MLKQIQKTLFKILEKELLIVLAVLVLAIFGFWVNAAGDSITFSLSVIPAGGTITVTYPNGGEDWKINITETITWTTQGSIADVKIELQRTTGGSWEELTASTTNDGSFPWPVTSPTTTQALIKVSKFGDATVNDTSDAVFTISSASGGGGGSGGSGGIVYPPVIDDVVDTIQLLDVEPQEIYSPLGAYLKPKLRIPSSIMVAISPVLILEPSDSSISQEIKLLPRVLETLSVEDTRKVLILEAEIKPYSLPPGKYDLGIEINAEKIILAPKSIQVRSSTLAASWVRQSDYPTVAPGEEFELWVELRNTGTTTPWLREVPAQTRLGTSRPRDHDSDFQHESWLSKNRLIAIGQDTPPGEIARFTFKMRAPSKIGVYREYIEPVAEFSEWIGPDRGIYWDITIRGKVEPPTTGGIVELKKPESPQDELKLPENKVFIKVEKQYPTWIYWLLSQLGFI